MSFAQSKLESHVTQKVEAGTLAVVKTEYDGTMLGHLNFNFRDQDIKLQNSTVVLVIQSYLMHHTSHSDFIVLTAEGTLGWLFGDELSVVRNLK